MSTVGESKKPQLVKPQSDLAPQPSRPAVVDIEPQTDADPSELSELEDNNTYFQAIGTLYGKVQQFQEGGFFLQMGQNQYRIFIPRHRFRAWLNQNSSFPETPLFLRVYPKCFIIPRQEPEIHFHLIAWSVENRWEESPGLFLFKGIWQFLPQLKTPVLSIYRNRDAQDPSEKFKASHLPVLMRREDEAKPFRFNPKIPKEQLPKRWFIQAHFKLIPSRNCWGWVCDIAPPSEEIPRYKKPIKAIPTPEETKTSETTDTPS